VIPLALDQYFYGRVDHRLGCGPAPLYIRKRLCTEDELQEALQDLTSGRYDGAAQEVADRIRLEDGVNEAADAIEAYCAGG
jgi:UDP:flavonoid glycosyltransferase YjiC (YdhE family)